MFTVGRVDESIERWIDQAHPPTAWVGVVRGWALGLATNPTAGAMPADELPGFWYTTISGAEDATHGTVCLFRVDHESMTVDVSMVSTLRKPIKSP